METRTTRIGLWIWTGLVVAFLWIPLVIIGVYAFNSSNVQSWPIPGWTFHWFHVAWSNPDVRNSLRLSVEIALIATALALVLGSALAVACSQSNTPQATNAGQQPPAPVPSPADAPKPADTAAAPPQARPTRLTLVFPAE